MDLAKTTMLAMRDKNRRGNVECDFTTDQGIIKMSKILTRLRIDEVSAVDRGAGEGVKIMLAKRDGKHLKRQFRRVKSADKPFVRTGKFDKFFGISKADDDNGVLSRSEYEREVMRGNEGRTSANTADEFRGGDHSRLLDYVVLGGLCLGPP
jgi:hypothetical protein